MIYIMKRIGRQLFAFFLLAGGLLFAHWALAQGFGVNEVANGLNNSLTQTDPRVVAGRIINITLGFLGVIAVGLAIYAGYLWMSSGGDEEKVESAKKILRNAVIGLVIILCSWAIATFLISKLGGATGNGGLSGTCQSGESASCGCGGSMFCSNGAFGACLGSNCNGSATPPSSCDSSPNPGCQATPQMCAAGYYCDANDCGCKTQGGLGDSCNANPAGGTCTADNSRCGNYLTCSASTCTCVGSPVITSVSPVGGFCAESIDKACATDADCATTCNLTSPNGAANNLITISGQNFGAYSATSSQVIFAGQNSAAIIKNGSDYAVTNPTTLPCAVNFNGHLPAGATASCSDAIWDYQFNVAQAGSYQVWVETTNANSSPYGDLDTFAPAGDEENTCAAPGVQHHINIYLDGVLQGSVCNPAVGPNKTKQLGTVNINSISAGAHTISIGWDNDWTYNPDGVWNTADDADSNLELYRVGLVSANLTAGRQPSVLNNACINTWTDKQIVIAVPPGAQSGSITVVNSARQTDSTNDAYGPMLPNFQVNSIARPGLCALNPQSGALSSQVNYQGVNLFSSNAYFGNYQTNVAALNSQFTNSAGLTGTSTTPNIRTGQTGSFVQNTASGAAEKSNYLNFTKAADPGAGPFITGFSPTRGAPGQYVTIRGQGFGGARGLNKVFFGNQEAAYDFPDQCLNAVWSDSQIIVKVPAGISNGYQTIQVRIGTTTIDTQKLNPDAFQADNTAALAPSLCQIDPERGPATTPVTLWGEYFGHLNSQGLVQFNAGQNATGTITQDGQADIIKTAVPAGAISGPVQVVNNSAAGNSLNFNVGACTADADCGGTAVCCPANTYKQGNCAATLADCSAHIPTSVFEWKFNTGFNTNDPCAAYTTAAECAQNSACCFDSKGTNDASDDTCRTGGAISSGTDKGYCAYYQCATTNVTQCASTTPLKVGAYLGTSTCATECAKPDPCPSLTTAATCGQNPRCCFDDKIAIATSTVITATSSTPAVCRSGSAIATGTDAGYCAYYDCSATNAAQCATSTPVKIGLYSNLGSCGHYCANPPSGAGLSCAGVTATSTCNTNQCNYPSLSCLNSDGSSGQTAAGCGTCCCAPGTTDSLTGWKCLADKGACTGASRGLFCGCASDDQCGSATTIGCGSDTCCQARPAITSTAPAHLANNVCRNAVVTATFNQAMDAASFSGNVFLLEEHSYGSGVCPAGTFIAQSDSLADILAQKNESWLARLWDNLTASIARLAGQGGGSALAAKPDPAKLYCAVPGTISGENYGSSSAVLTFAPQRLLSPATNYYLVVKGDEALNSKTGVLSADGIGLNGLGYLDPATGAYVPGANVTFNNRAYKDSQIIKFTTLPAQSADAGICAIDNVKVSPTSYLFNTTDNALNENDASATDPTFDTAADRDKVFTATAYSSDGQALHPVTGYFWDWDFQAANPKIVALSLASNLPANRILATAQAGVTDGSTKLTATISMSRFSGGSCAGGSCSCQGTNCSNNCCNAYTGGDGFNNNASLYVFLCNNPWPPVAADGNWSPWTDNCQNAVNPATCADYNYKFYYCRDAGTSGTTDDLPAILSQPVIRGFDTSTPNGTKLICSTDGSACPTANDPCGQGGSGFCIWSVLKESYFFRAAVPTSGQMLSATDQGTGGAVKVSWTSASGQAASYKIYYLMSGVGAMLSQAVKTAACTTVENVNTCSATITGLANKQPYVFKVSVISADQAESQLSDELTATPTDVTPPPPPTGLQGTFGTSSVSFSWTPDTAETVTYRLYHGISSGNYGESFDSAPGASGLNFPAGQFASSSANYFALSALDASGNESSKSRELACVGGQCVLSNFYAQ